MNFSFPNLKWGISEKDDGAMNLRLPDSHPENIENRKKFFHKLAIEPTRTVAAELVHGNEIAIVSEDHFNQIIPEKDGLVTNTKGLFLTVTIADCVPIYYFDKAKNIIGIAHCGWRGTVKNISKTLVETMINTFDSNPADITAYIGPHIQKCHFEIKEDILNHFSPGFIIKDQNSLKVNLLSMIKHQLISLGIPHQNIDSSDHCTYCNPEKYFSYRREKSDKVESMVAFIGLV
jgi:YfiH family protein